MPIKYQSIYPPYWKQFSEYIRFERAKGKCEECGLENGAIGYRVEGAWIYAEDYLAVKAGKANFYVTTGRTRIVLTVAHLDHDGGICDCKARTGRKCAIPSHVEALCQACHLRMDLPKHIENAKQTRILKNDAKRGLFSEIAA